MNDASGKDNRKDGAAFRQSIAESLPYYVPGQAKSKKVSRSEWKSEWPFTVDHVTLYCKGSAVYIESNGKKYALNGVARHVGHPNFTPLWKKNSSELGNVDISAMIQEGLGL